MPYWKRFICLAVSTKTGGLCVAGKEGKRWVRAVSARPTAELSAEECQYADGSAPQLLDVVEVVFDRPEPRDHQVENHVIANRIWQKTGRAKYAELENLVDDRMSLWTNGEHTANGENDCVTAAIAEQFNSSLVLVKPPDLCVRVGARKSVRACFTLQDVHYVLKVTDPVARCGFQDKAPRDYPIDAYLCVSLTEAFRGDQRCHKLAAGLIGADK